VGNSFTKQPGTILALARTMPKKLARFLQLQVSCQKAGMILANASSMPNPMARFLH
jgi:hypothetical protein